MTQQYSIKKYNINSLGSITFIKGDLLTFPKGINVMLHQANICNVMGAGIAAQIAAKWPEVYEADTIAYNMVDDYNNWAKLEGEQTKSLLGTFSHAFVDSDNPKLKNLVVNLYGQQLHTSNSNTPGKFTSYDAVDNALHNLMHHFRTYTVQRGADYNSLGELVNDPFTSTKFTKKEFGYKTNEAFRPVFGVPYLMGCGLGGGNWATYQSLLEHHIVNTCGFDLVVVEYDV